MRIILASTSPRRKKIFSLLGLPFETLPPSFDETLLPDQPVELEVRRFALGKAKSVAANNSDSIIIGSDTMIALEGRTIGKPSDRKDAEEILGFLSGKTHLILTAVAVVNTAKRAEWIHLEKVWVTMRAFSEEEIARYVGIGESLDKAGAYSIQGEGRSLIESIEGDYLAAVGLPLKPIADFLRKEGFAVPYAEEIGRLRLED